MRWVILLLIGLFLYACMPAYNSHPPEIPELKPDLCKLKWKRYVGKINYVDTNQPLIYGDKVLFATNGDKNNKKDEYDKLYVFEKDGNLLWSFSSPDGGDTGLNGVVACNRFIAVTSDEGYVYELSWKGKVLWKRKVGKYPLAFSIFDINRDGYPDLLVGENIGTLYAFNGKDGSLLWKFETGHAIIYSSPAIGDIDRDGKAEVVFGSCDNNLYALNGEDGSLLWKFKTGRAIYSSPAIGDINGDGRAEVVFGSDDNNLYALNGEDGSLLWRFKTGNDIDSSPAIGDIDGDGKAEVVFGSEDDNLYALNGKDGSLLWKFETGDYVDSSPAIGDIDGDGRPEVVFGSEDDNLYALNGEDGSLLWKFKTGNYVCSSPAIGDVDGNGKIDIAVASRDGYLYLFEVNASHGKIIWSRWHGDASGTGVYENAVSFAEANLSGNAFAWYPGKKISRAYASAPPYLEIISVRLSDEDGDRLFEAGESGSLVIKIANSGKGTAYGMNLRVSSPIFSKKIHIQKLAPRQKITREISFKVPIKVKTGKIYANVKLDAGKYSPEPVKVTFTTKAAIPPKFRIVYKIDDDMVGESAGNANGIVEPRETVELFVTVKNVGRGEAKDVKLRLKSNDVEMIKGTARIGNLPPGSSARGKLVFFVPANLNKKKADFSLKIEEALGIFTTSTKLALNVRKQGGKIYNYAVAYKEEVPYSSPGVEVKAIQPSQPSRNCARPNPNYYFFGIVVYDYLAISHLTFVKNDKSLIKKLATCYMGIPEENIKILENPSYAYLKEQLRKFARRIIRKDATLYFYYSGHGILDSKGKFYILPVDASIEDETALKESGVNIEELKGLLARAKGKKVALVDACRVTPPWKPAVLISKPRLKDMAIIFSTKKGQLSNMDKERRYSAFTRALYEMAKSGLSNLDFDDDGYVEIKELIRPLTNWVRKVSADSRQTPDVWGQKGFEIFPVP